MELRKKKAADMSGPKRQEDVSSQERMERPLCIDLDGTLVKTDTLVESLVILFKTNPLHILSVMWWVLSGKAHLKTKVAERVQLDYSALPYNTELVEWLRSEQSAGRKLVLVTGAHETIAYGVAGQLFLFSETYGSNDTVNLTGHQKADLLTVLYGERGFDYAGNSSSDVAAWEKAHSTILVNTPKSLARRAKQGLNVSHEFTGYAFSFKSVFKALRIHQWAKNALLFIPLLLSAKFGLDLLLDATIAFFSFSLCASSGYLLNDIMDLPADRVHPDKKDRPLASGALPLSFGITMYPLLLAASFGVSLLIPLDFTLLLLGYLIINLGYSFKLKQIPMLDIVTLSSLYTLRLYAGALAVAVAISPWLLAFSLFFFLSLAMIKRSSELIVMIEMGKDSSSGRGYVTRDLPQISALGSAAGYISVLVLALYINSDAVREIYYKPDNLWPICLLQIYWIGRIWLIAGRGEMHHDPVLFATKDKVSYVVLALAFISWVLAKGFFH